MVGGSLSVSVSVMLVGFRVLRKRIVGFLSVWVVGVLFLFDKKCIEVARSTQALPEQRCDTLRISCASTIPSVWVSHVPSPIFSTSYNRIKRIIRKLLSMEFQWQLKYYN